jgi:hypothetical protein
VYDARKESEGRVQKTVESSFEFINFGEIDTMTSVFQAEVIIESKWIFIDGDIGDSSQTVMYDPKTHWNPKLYIENAKAINKEEVSYEMVKEKDVTFVIEKRHVKGKHDLE